MEHSKTYIPPPTRAACISRFETQFGREEGGKRGESKNHVSGRVSSRKRRKGVDRWYAGVRITEKFPRRLEWGDQRARETKELSLPAQDEAMNSSETEWEREITKASPRYPVIAPWRVRGGALMATMQIPIPALMLVISRETIEEEACMHPSPFSFPSPLGDARFCGLFSA